MLRALNAGDRSVAEPLAAALIRSGEVEELAKVARQLTTEAVARFEEAGAYRFMFASEASRRESLMKTELGRRVRLVNKRARPKFRSTLERVPHGTEGVVRYVGNGYRDGTSILIETAEGLEFFTAAKHVEVLDTYEEVDARVQRAEREWLSFDRPAKGDTIHASGRTGRVFWIGSARHATNPNAWRVGFRDNGATVFVNGDAMEAINGQPTSQAGALV
jgi:hypothetical protein